MPLAARGALRWSPPATDLTGKQRSKFIQDDLRSNGLVGMADVMPLLGEPGPFVVDEGSPQATSVQNVVEAYSKVGPTNIATNIENNAREKNSWHRIVCPPGRANGLQSREMTTLIWDLQMPGRRAPFTETDRVTHREETVVVHMYQHQIGAEFELAQLQKPGTGQLYFEQGLKSMYNGILLQGELAVHKAIASAKRMYTNYATPSTVAYKSAVERTTALYELFGIIQRSEMGFRQLLSSVKKLMEDTSTSMRVGERAYEFVVVTQGVLDQLYAGNPDSTTHAVAGAEAQGPRKFGLDYYRMYGNVAIIEEKVSVFAKSGGDDVTNPMVRRVWTGLYWTSTNEYTDTYNLTPGCDDPTRNPNTKACRAISFLNFRGNIEQDKMSIHDLIDNAICFDPDSPYGGLRHDIYQTIAENPTAQLTTLNATAKTTARSGDVQIDPLIYETAVEGKYQVAEYWGQVETQYCKNWFYKRAAAVANSIISEAIGKENIEMIKRLLDYLDTGYKVERTTEAYQEYVKLVRTKGKNVYGVEDLPKIEANGLLVAGGAVSLTPGSAPPGFSTAAHAAYLSSLHEANKRGGDYAPWRDAATDFGTQFNLDLKMVNAGWKAFQSYYREAKAMFGKVDRYSSNGEDTDFLENILFRPESCPDFIAPTGSGRKARDLRSQYAFFSIALQGYRVPTGVEIVAGGNVRQSASRISDADATAILNSINANIGSVALDSGNANNIAAIRYMLENSPDPAFNKALNDGLAKLIKTWNHKTVQAQTIQLEDANGDTLNAAEFLKEYIFSENDPTVWANNSTERPQRTNLLRVTVNKMSKARRTPIDPAFVAQARASAPADLGVAEIADAEDAIAAAARSGNAADYKILSLSVDASFWHSNGTVADNQAIADLEIRPADAIDPNNDVVQPQAGQAPADVVEELRRFGYGHMGGDYMHDEARTASFERSEDGEGSTLLWPCLTDLTTSPSFVARATDLADGHLESHPFFRAMMYAYMLTPIYGESLKQMAEMNMLLPLSFVAIAPFIELLTNPAYFLNPNIGGSLYDYEQLILGTAANIQYIFVDATWYMTAFIERADRMMVVDSVRIEQYVRGMDNSYMCRFGTGTRNQSQEYFNGNAGKVDIELTKFDNRTGSIIVGYMGATQTDNDIDDVIDVSGRISDNGDMKADYTAGARAKMKELTLPCSIAMALITGWNKLNEGRVYRDETWEDMCATNVINTRACRAWQGDFNPSAMAYTNVKHKGIGPLAAFRPGNGNILNGQVGSLSSIVPLTA